MTSFSGQGALAGAQVRHEALHRSGDPGEEQVPRGACRHLVLRNRSGRHAQWRYTGSNPGANLTIASFTTTKMVLW
jgi:hypothetical protein